MASIRNQNEPSAEVTPRTDVPIGVGGVLAGFLRELATVWRRQQKAWHVVVTWMIVNRFLRRFVEQYASIYIRLLGASAVELGAAQSAAGIAGILIALPLGIAHDRYSLRKIYLTGITLQTIAPLIFAVAPGWQWIIPAVVLLYLGQRLGSCAVICDVSAQSRPGNQQGPLRGSARCRRC